MMEDADGARKDILVALHLNPDNEEVELDNDLFYLITGLFAQLLKTSLSVLDVWGSIPGPVKLDAVSPPLRCYFGAVLCGAKPRRRAPPLVTRLGVIQQIL